jgi:Uma2 family endonuclease
MLPAKVIKKRYTYAEYCTWGEDVRCELIDGVVYDMSPAPGTLHQGISGNIHGQLFIFLQNKHCKVFSAPFDVRLHAGDDYTVVQPDIVVICDNSKITKAGCTGAPDMVIEILSPSTASKDMLLKYTKYLQAGVREYWVVDPQTRIVRVMILNDGKYDSIDYLEAGLIPVRVLEGCEIDMKRAFEDLGIDFGEPASPLS